MRVNREILADPAFAGNKPLPSGRCAVTSSKPLPPQPSWFGRLFRHREPSTFQRCLAVHMHYAAPRNTLS